MKHIKIYEDFDDNFEVGDYVIVVSAYSSNKIKTGDRCKVIGPGLSSQYFIIENEDGIREDYRKNRIEPEIKYFTNKFNI